MIFDFTVFWQVFRSHPEPGDVYGECIEPSVRKVCRCRKAMICGVKMDKKTNQKVLQVDLKLIWAHLVLTKANLNIVFHILQQAGPPISDPVELNLYCTFKTQ